MANFKTKAAKKLDQEIGHALDKYQQELFKNLVRLTPIDTGQAQKGWREISKMSALLDTNKTRVVIRNDVPYIQRLDDGYSKQAPQGIVKPALQKTRKP